MFSIWVKAFYISIAMVLATGPCLIEIYRAVLPFENNLKYLFISYLLGNNNEKIDLIKNMVLTTNL